MVLALTGGIGAGKSAALAAFARAGAPVLSSDDVVHQLYRDPQVRTAIVERFGAGVLAPDGSVDRTVLGRLVFDQPAAKADVEGLLFPRIRATRDRWIARQQAVEPPPPLLVCEVPLLYEAQLEGLFDGVIVISAGERVRQERVSARGQDFAARARHQLPEDIKIARADHAYINDGSLEQLDAWVRALYDRYRDDAADIPI